MVQQIGTNPEEPTVDDIDLKISRDDARLLHNAVRVYISDFGHDEFEVRDRAQDLLGRLDRALATPDGLTSSTPA